MSYKELLDVSLSIAAILGGGSAVYFAIKSGSQKASQQTAANYKMLYESEKESKLELKVEYDAKFLRLENQIKELSDKMISQYAEIQELKTENTNLKNTLTLRDPELMKKIADGFCAMGEIKNLLVVHDKRTKNLEEFCLKDVKPFVKGNNGQNKTVS